MLTRISATNVPIDQFEAELQHICGMFSGHPADARHDTRAVVALAEHSAIEMAHVASDLQMISRTRRDIRLDDGENFFLIVQEEGRALMSQNDVARMLQPGDMILIDSAQLSEFTFFGKFQRQVSLHLPRVEMNMRFGSQARGGLFLSHTDHTARALAAIVAKAFHTSASEQQSLYLREALFGLIGTMLYERSDQNIEIDADVSGAQSLRNGLAYIDRHFSDNTLNIQKIADDLGVSIRRLQRSFALLGVTPSDYLLQKRLEYACHLLRARRSNDEALLVSTIAYSSGFNDVSYFNRQFRRAFGCAPGQYGIAN